MKGTGDGYLGLPAVGWRPPIVEPERALYLWGPIVLQPIDPATTRVIFRSRGPALTPPGRAFAIGFYDPVHFVMERGMMLGLKARAEGTSDPPLALTLLAVAGWTAAGLGTLWALLRQRWGRVAGLLPALSFVAILLSTHDVRAATAAFIALGLPLAGFVTSGWRWWPTFSLIAAAVLLVLLLAEEAYLAFGLSFLVAALLLAVAARRQLARLAPGQASH